MNTGYIYDPTEAERNRNEFKTCVKFLFEFPNKARRLKYYNYWWNRTVAAFKAMTRPTVERWVDALLAWYYKDGLTMEEREHFLDLVEYARNDPAHDRYAVGSKAWFESVDEIPF